MLRRIEDAKSGSIRERLKQDIDTDFCFAFLFAPELFRKPRMALFCLSGISLGSNSARLELTRAADKPVCEFTPRRYRSCGSGRLFISVFESKTRIFAFPRTLQTFIYTRTRRIFRIIIVSYPPMVYINRGRKDRTCIPSATRRSS